ncbi:MAG TPA: PHB depolymerase family esterase [Polyangiaceae bacterium]|nr:PHB depolymerase family esterase [Polyangiaceae bacterium]
MMGRFAIAALGVACCLVASNCGSSPSGAPDQGHAVGASSGSGAASGSLGGSGAPGGTGSAAGERSGGGSSSGSAGTSGASSGTSSGASLAGDGGSSTSGAEGGAGGADAATTCTKTVTPSMDCSAPLAPGDEKHCMLGSRSYYIYAPKTFNVCQPAALVLDAHGATQTAQSQFLGMPPFCTGTTCWNGPGSGWRLEADTPGGGFILVTPDSATSANTWDTTSDPMYMIQLIAQVKTVATVDPKKIYISGISNGAQLSNVTACLNPGVFAGIAPNSGGVLGGTQCNMLSKPQTDIQFDDMPDFAFSDSQSTVTNMAKVDNCKTGPTNWKTIDSTTTDPICLLNPDDNKTTLVPCNTIMPAVMPTTCQIWDQCDGGVKVVFCQVAAGTLHGSANAAIDGHIIYENNTHLNTPSLAWRFFKSFW